MKDNQIIVISSHMFSFCFLFIIIFSSSLINICCCTSSPPACIVSLNGTDTNGCGGTLSTACSSISKCVYDELPLLNNSMGIARVLLVTGTYVGISNCNVSVDYNLMVNTYSGYQDVIIDCGSATRHFTFMQNSALYSDVSNIAFRNGQTIGNGGCIWAKTSLFVTNCDFEGCVANQGAGGAIYFDSIASPPISTTQISNTIFSNNRATLGGAVCSQFTETYIVQCNFSANSASQGAGLWLQSRASVSNTVFNGNYAAQSGGGICFGPETGGTINQCTLTHNQAAYGGGIYVSDTTGTSGLNINGTSFELNDALGYGGGLYISATAQTVVTYSVISNNIGGGVYIDARRLSGTIARLVWTGTIIVQNIARSLWAAGGAQIDTSQNTPQNFAIAGVSFWGNSLIDAACSFPNNVPYCAALNNSCFAENCSFCAGSCLQVANETNCADSQPLNCVHGQCQFPSKQTVESPSDIIQPLCICEHNWEGAVCDSVPEKPGSCGIFAHCWYWSFVGIGGFVVLLVAVILFLKLTNKEKKYITLD